MKKLLQLINNFTAYCFGDEWEPLTLKEFLGLLIGLPILWLFFVVVICLFG